MLSSTCRACDFHWQEKIERAALYHPQNKILTINEVCGGGTHKQSHTTSFGGKFLAIFFPRNFILQPNNKATWGLPSLEIPFPCLDIIIFKPGMFKVILKFPTSINSQRRRTFKTINLIEGTRSVNPGSP